jgi:hypothetical protein
MSSPIEIRAKALCSTHTRLSLARLLGVGRAEVRAADGSPAKLRRYLKGVARWRRKRSWRSNFPPVCVHLVMFGRVQVVVVVEITPVFSRAATMMES